MSYIIGMWLKTFKGTTQMLWETIIDIFHYLLTM